MPRGFTWCVYVDDTGQLWALQVDSDSVEEPQRGWSSDGVEALEPLPRGFVPRVVLGAETDGTIRKARVATTTAALWTGEADSFQAEGSDGLFHSCTVIGTRSERRRPPTSPP